MNLQLNRRAPTCEASLDTSQHMLCIQLVGQQRHNSQVARHRQRGKAGSIRMLR